MTQPLTNKSINSIRSNLHMWFTTNGRNYPWRQTTNPYAILVSEVMLQQTQIATVLNKGYYLKWMQQFPDLHSLATAPEQEILRAWEGLGYYNRARNLQRLAQHLIHHHKGTFPTNPKDLLALPGIGPYTAGAIASFAFNAPAPAVDANITRVLSRLLNYRKCVDTHAAKTLLWHTATTLIPPNGARIHNSALMELGQLVCTPKNPACSLCPINSSCQAQHLSPESLPRKKPRKSTIHLNEHTLLALHNHQILLHMESGRRRTGLWKLPARPANSIHHLPLLHHAHYQITHHRVHLHIHQPSHKPTPQTNEHWINQSNLHQLPMPSPYRKALQSLGLVQ